MFFKTNCRHWLGYKPCREKRSCQGCPAFSPLGPRILLVKLGARGDVLRTTPLVAGLKNKYPDSHLTWITAPESFEILQNLPGLDQTLIFKLEHILEIQTRHFELAICLDKEPQALALLEACRAERKLGWGMARDGVGTACSLSPEADYSLALGVDDDLKFRQNQKNYMEIIFEAVGLAYQGEPYAFQLAAADRLRCRQFLEREGVHPGERILGLFTGCGPAFQHKRWNEEGFGRLAARARQELGARILLLAGPEERDINQRIGRLAGVPVLDTRGEHSLRELGGFLEACRVVVTGDTLALHLSLALKRPVVALFGPTCPQEISLFGLGEKIMTPLDCGPCYLRTCGKKPNCMDSITLETIWPALVRQWEAA